MNERDDCTKGLDAAEVGAEESESKISGCEDPVHSMEQPVHESQVSFLEEVGEAYEPQMVVLGTAEDGLPAPVDSGELAIAPPFTYENVVCVGDSRSYVEVFIEDVEAEAYADKTSYLYGVITGLFGYVRKPESKYLQDTGTERQKREFTPAEVQTRWGLLVVHDPKYQTWILVKPKRIQCVHYQRQLFLNDDQPDPNAPGHKIIFRNCAKRTSIGGAAMSLRDEAVLACTWRSPRDPESEAKHLDAFDEERLKTQPHLKRLPLFGG